jgi:small ligand-binding sensory domain FIST
MRWASALSRRSVTAAAFREAAEALEPQLQGGAPDLLLAFLSPEHARGCEQLGTLAERRFPGALLVGCTAGGVIGGAREAEDGPALSLTAAVLPGTALSAFRVGPSGSRAAAGEAGWRDQVGAPPEARPSFLLLADPFTADVSGVIEGLDRAYPGAPKFGGLASGGRGPAENRLLLRKEVHAAGTVGVAFSGALEVETLIAQGCRRIGEPMVVTRCRHTLLQEVDGRPPLQAMAELYGSLDVRDRELMQHSLFLGLELRSDAGWEQGEVLVRNLMGFDQGTGAVAVGAELRPMMVAQFVLRDAHSAEEELRGMLAQRRRASADRPSGALLFSCVGRGAGLFGHADHDTSLFEEQLGPAPLGGFFCNGEIGPVGGRTYLHGYTSAFALFKEPRSPAPMGSR